MAVFGSPISVTSATRERLWKIKGPGRQVTYDSLINMALDAYEEKLNESRSQAATDETGNHEGDQ